MDSGRQVTGRWAAGRTGGGAAAPSAGREEYRRRQNAGLVLLLLLLATVSGTLAFGYPLLDELAEVNRSRYESFLLADRLRQSSDDLTRMVRTYAATGNPVYRDQFYQVLAIRDGEAPRPENYEGIYWDLVLSPTDRPAGGTGGRISLRKLMVEAGFSAGELALLNLAEDRSNALVLLEEEAMNAMEGRVKGPGGDYVATGKPDRERALEILFSREYHEAKRSIMLPIQQFFKVLEERTRESVESRERRVEYIVIALILQVLLAAATVLFLLASGRKPRRSGTPTAAGRRGKPALPRARTGSRPEVETKGPAD
jgi:methyl-accepting chemotaxis protein